MIYTYTNQSLRANPRIKTFLTILKTWAKTIWKNPRRYHRSFKSMLCFIWRWSIPNHFATDWWKHAVLCRHWTKFQQEPSIFPSNSWKIVWYLQGTLTLFAEGLENKVKNVLDVAVTCFTLHSFCQIKRWNLPWQGWYFFRI